MHLVALRRATRAVAGLQGWVRGGRAACLLQALLSARCRFAWASSQLFVWQDWFVLLFSPVT